MVFTILKERKHYNPIFYFQRDLAARNVLLNHSLTAKVADFGLSARTYMKANGNQLFGANQDTFPFRWSAFEMLQNGVAIKEKSDVWSFGVFIWELFYLGAALPYGHISGKSFKIFMSL